MRNFFPWVALVICFFSATLFQVNASVKSYRFSDYQSHSCVRDCSEFPERRVCVYDFTVEIYATLTRACYDCPKNGTDCLREHCITANGFKDRVVEVVNRLLPGPAIQVCYGDQVIVNVMNSLRSERVTSIHWHGILQKGTPYMDGVGMVTQYPIMPHTSFQYKFYADNAGTHMWHSHSGSQRGDGMFGAFIVRESRSRDPNSAQYDRDMPEHYIILNDWTHVPLQIQFAPYMHSGGYGSAKAILINGKGREMSNVTNPTPLATFFVSKGFRYRFRLINAGLQFCPMYLSIDDHELTVIASDGNSIEPMKVKTLVSSPGERYDFVIETNGEEKDYWIRVTGEGDCDYNKLHQVAVLKYEHSSNAVENPELTSKNAPTDYAQAYQPGKQLRSFLPSLHNDSYVLIGDLRYPENIDPRHMRYFERISGTPHRKFYMSIDLNPLNMNEVHQQELYPLSKANSQFWPTQINNITFMMPPLPAILAWKKIPMNMVCNETHKKHACNEEGFCACVHTIQLELNELVEIVLVDEAHFYEAHPMHLHGHKFAVLSNEKVGKTLSVDQVKKMDQEGLLKRNLERPVIKDTLNVPTGGYAVIRFRADNPGFWLFHCHLEMHSEPGMIVMFKVGHQCDLPRVPDNIMHL